MTATAPTVRDVAQAEGVSRSTVRRAIADGHLRVSNERPMRIIDGALPWLQSRWCAELEAVFGRAGIKRHLYGFTEEGVAKILRGTEIISIPVGIGLRDFDAVKRLLGVST